MFSISTIALFISIFALAACATVGISEMPQSVRVKAIAPDGLEVKEVNCTLRNDNGTWSVVTPGAVNVVPSNSALHISCNKSGFQVENQILEKMKEGYILRDLGAMGKLIIGSSTTARPAFMTQGGEINQPMYPSSITVVMYSNAIKSPQNSTPPTSNSTNVPRPNFDMDLAQKQCAEIGLVKGTENFGLCVMKLLK